MLAGADFILITISTGGLDTMKHDLEIPEKYGIRHTVGDTVGPGGWSRCIRNVPVFYSIAGAVKRICPNAWILNMSNPLTPLTRVPSKYFGLKTIGMCPGVEEMVRTLVGLAGFDPAAARADFTVTGIDHGSWITGIYANGVNVFDLLKEKGYFRLDDTIPDVQFNDPLMGECSIRAAFALWRLYGCFPAISDRHTVENHSWYIGNRKDDNLPFALKRTYIGDRKKWYAEMLRKHKAYLQGELPADGVIAGHGNDPVPAVVEALSGGSEFYWASNYGNIGQIEGLPSGAVVETRCRFDSAGVHPFTSPMPDIIKILTLPTVLRQEAILDIALTGTFDELVAIMASDPLCAHLPPVQIQKMARELVEANSDYIPNCNLKKFN